MRELRADRGGNLDVRTTRDADDPRAARDPGLALARLIHSRTWADAPHLRSDIVNDRPLKGAA